MIDMDKIENDVRNAPNTSWVIEISRPSVLELIERVRAIHRETGAGGDCVVCKEWGWPCPTVAALDGAPEPEWEYQCTNRFSTTGLVGDPELHARQCSGKIERRRKAGPWLPVEGEKP